MTKNNLSACAWRLVKEFVGIYHIPGLDYSKTALLYIISKNTMTKTEHMDVLKTREQKNQLFTKPLQAVISQKNFTK